MVNDKHYNRRFLLILVTIAIVGIYIARLIYLQLVNTNYKQRAENNAYYYKPIYPRRGLIKDRNGNVLVSNTPTYDLMVTMKEVTNLDTVQLANLLSIDPDYLKERFRTIKDRKKNRGYSPYIPQLLLQELSPEATDKFKEQLYKYPGFFIQNRFVRKYDYNHAAHVLGYLSEASISDFRKDSTLLKGDYVGNMGVEKIYDKVLRGKKGVEILLRDARGHIKGHYNKGKNDEPPQDGANITLTIDTALQNLGEKLMQGKRGAIVVTQPTTGEILAIVDAPSYTPSMLSGPDRSKNIRNLEKSPGKPLYPRSIMGMYPPGSTFKLAQAAIYLQEHAITPSTLFPCHNGYTLLHGHPHCHSHPSPLSLIPAIATSCNSYFSWGLHELLDNRELYPTVEIALEHWKNWMVKIGYGYPLGVDLPGEKRGFIPNSKFYDRIYKKNWSSASIISIAIGQGEILVTPLQLANMVDIIANRGWYYIPHIVKSITGCAINTKYTTKKTVGISPDIWAYVVQGMQKAVSGGTCVIANFDPSNTIVCGKTGTAQNPHGKDHSVFVGFAPKDNPQVAVAVYVENGGFGASVAVPIGRLMMEYYLHNHKLSPTSQNIKTAMEQRSIYYTND